MNTWKNTHFITYIKKYNPHGSIVCYKPNILSVHIRLRFDLAKKEMVDGSCFFPLQ